MLAAWSTCAGPHLPGGLDARADDVARRPRASAGTSGCRRCPDRRRGRPGSGRHPPSSRPRSAPARAPWRDRPRWRRGPGPSAAAGVRRDGWPARRSGRPGSGSSGGSARSRRRSATRRTPDRRGRSGRPCAGRYSVGPGSRVGPRMTPSASATTSNSPLLISWAKPRHAGTGGGRDPAVEGDPLDLVELRGRERRAVGADGVADQVEVGAQRDPASRGRRRRPPGCRPGSGRGRRRPRRCGPASARSRACQTCENGCCGTQHERGRRRRRPARPCGPSRGSAWRPRSSRRRRWAPGRVVLVPGVPVGARSERNRQRERGQRDEQQHRRAQGEQPGGQEQEQHRADLVAGALLQDAPGVAEAVGRVAVRRSCRCPPSRAAATRSAPRTRRRRTPSRAAPSRREPRRKTTKPEGGDRQRRGPP